MLTETFRVQTNEKDFFKMRTAMKQFDPKVEYPGYLDSSYWLFFEVPVNMVNSVRETILAIQGK